MKSQVLADFLVESTWIREQSEEPYVAPLDAVPDEAGEDWILHIDGASNSQGSRADLILTSPKGMVVEYALWFLFQATDNQVEYEALLAGIKLMRELKVKCLRAFINSQLIFRQITREYEAWLPTMSRYLSKIQSQTSFFTHFSISYIPRSENARADALSRLATSVDEALGRTYVEHLEVPSIDGVEEALPVSQKPTWMDAYNCCLIDDTLSTNHAKAKLLKWRASKFLVLDRWLYRRSFSYPLLKCVGPANVDYILREIHEGICGNHLGGKVLAYKALR